MSVDLAGWINYGATGVALLILILGIVRAVEIRRAFVNPIFRSRATWMALLMVVIIIVNIDGLTPASSAFGLLGLVGFLPFLALILVIYAYVDGCVRVAIETDFFHRETLGWSRVRRPVGICLFVSFVAAAVVPTIVPTATAIPFWGSAVLNGSFVVIVLILAYCAAAMVIGARRSPNKSLRKSILLLGISLFTFVLTLIITSPLVQGTLAFVILNQGLSIPGIYLLYLSVSSLSTLARKIEA